MKKASLLLFALLLIGSLAALPSVIDAQGSQQSFVPLEKIPGLTDGGNINFPTFLNALFKILIGAGAIIAVLTLVLGGVQYIMSEAVGGKEEAKTRMFNSIGGLILLLVSWLILYTINPNLVTFNLNVIGSSTLADRNGIRTNYQPNNPDAVFAGLKLVGSPSSGPSAAPSSNLRNCSTHPTLGTVCEGQIYADIDGTRYVISKGTPVRESDYTNSAAGFDDAFVKAVVAAGFKTSAYPANGELSNADLTRLAQEETAQLITNGGNQAYMAARRSCVEAGFVFASFGETWTCSDYTKKTVDVRANPASISELDANQKFMSLSKEEATPQACLNSVRKLCWFYQTVEANAFGGRTSSYTYNEAPDGSCSCIASFK